MTAIRKPVLALADKLCVNIGNFALFPDFPASSSCAGDSGKIGCSAAPMALLIVIFDL